MTAYLWGYSDNISFRKGSLTVSVSSVSGIDSLLPALDMNERANLSRAEEAAMNRNFAQIGGEDSLQFRWSMSAEAAILNCSLIL